MSKQMIVFVFTALLFLTACNSDYEEEMQEVFSSEKNYAEEEHALKLGEVDSEVAVYQSGKYISVSYTPEENEEIVGVYERNSKSGYDRMADESAIDGKEAVIIKATIID
ncbi:hypothetical protein SFC66_11365 [Terribacillus saccharophilus]|uniref:hypothetical protein n=1 Tax=Terribacillus saccharophilus TaxID=361277 RepID=UPI0039825F21